MSRILFWEPWNMEEDIDEGVQKLFDSQNENMEEIEGLSMAPVNIKTISALATPFGFFPVTEDNYPSKSFNIWKAHTNFRLTEQDVDNICNVDGVEVFKEFSEYRFLIAIARLFNGALVKKSIQEVLGIELPQEKRMKTMDLSMEDKDRIFQEAARLKDIKHWTILMLPNEKIVSIHSNELSEGYKREVEMLRAVYSAVGGRFIESENEHNPGNQEKLH